MFEVLDILEYKLRTCKYAKTELGIPRRDKAYKVKLITFTCFEAHSTLRSSDSESLSPLYFIIVIISSTGECARINQINSNSVVVPHIPLIFTTLSSLKYEPDRHCSFIKCTRGFESAKVGSTYRVEKIGNYIPEIKAAVNKNFGKEIGKGKRTLKLTEIVSSSKFGALPSRENKTLTSFLLSNLISLSSSANRWSSMVGSLSGTL